MNRIRITIPIILMAAGIYFSGCRSREFLKEEKIFELWRLDPGGCNGSRMVLADSLMDYRNQLLGLNEEKIIDYLGYPDKSELYKRNQKFFLYYIDPKPECLASSSDPEMIVVRMNAMGICNEIFRQRGFSTQ